MKHWKASWIATLAGLLVTSSLHAQLMEDTLDPDPRYNALVEQSFSAPEVWTRELSQQQGWGSQNPRMLADVNGDGKQDMIGFGTQGTWVAFSTGSSFTPRFALTDFGYDQGWRVERHTRLMGDIDGDGKADIVGFGNAGVYTSLSRGSDFAGARFIINDLGYDQGWLPDLHTRLLADVNGDGKQDIVAFGNDGVWLSFTVGGGDFTAPAFVIQDFGLNQGWTNVRHIRTMADVNGDGKADIVGFGEKGVTIALSTGTGFQPPRFVLQGFSPLEFGGWRVDRHPRLLVDIDNDGRDDIVGFGDAGVWMARSTGTGFAPMRFIFANFGYNQGWRITNHPRFIADLNGDGFKDIIGYGQKSVYRALGTSTGFDPMRGVLRDLVADRSPFYSLIANRIAPRFLGDVSGDRLPDLVAVDAMDIKVAKSSTQPPPPAPAAPSNLRVTSTTPSSISIAWNDNSNNERRFIINYGKSGAGLTSTTTVGANSTTATIGSLTADTQYCFTVQAESLFDISAPTAQVCGRTGKAIHETSIALFRQVIIQGPVPYAGTFGPIFSGARILNINFPSAYAALLVKVGHSSEECNDPNAVVVVKGDMTPEQIKAVWGVTAPITITGQQRLTFVACTTNPQLPDTIDVNIRWQDL